ncbi:50S ribosomal protein L14 [Candidatus Gottesmanbacteria bacterium]|nr:50S ribosomal protein L14 [Candidatus Gottesmanbacteria bacterium]
MIQRRTSLTVADNSGARAMVVIHIYGSSKRKFAGLGDIVQCVVRKADPVGLVKEDELVKVVIARVHKEHGRPDGSYIRFDDNAGVIIDNPDDKNPRGTRIFGPVARELKEKGFHKIVSMASELF